MVQYQQYFLVFIRSIVDDSQKIKALKFAVSVFFQISVSGLIAQESLTLNDCIRVALQENPEYKNAERQTDIARSMKTDAYGAYLPNINAILSSSQKPPKSE